MHAPSIVKTNYDGTFSNRNIAMRHFEHSFSVYSGLLIRLKSFWTP